MMVRPRKKIPKVHPNSCGAYYLQMMSDDDRDAFNRFKALCNLESTTIRDRILEFIHLEAGRFDREVAKKR